MHNYIYNKLIFDYDNSIWNSLECALIMCAAKRENGTYIFDSTGQEKILQVVVNKLFDKDSTTSAMDKYRHEVGLSDVSKRWKTIKTDSSGDYKYLLSKLVQCTDKEGQEELKNALSRRFQFKFPEETKVDFKNRKEQMKFCVACAHAREKKNSSELHAILDGWIAEPPQNISSIMDTTIELLNFGADGSECAELVTDLFQKTVINALVSALNNDFDKGRINKTEYKQSIELIIKHCAALGIAANSVYSCAILSALRP